MVEIVPLDLPGLQLLIPDRHADDRGFFSETWREGTLDGEGAAPRFVQDNHVYSHASGTIRGLHYQLPPHAQAKLVRVSRGAIFDVVLDLRRDSSTFGQWRGITLSAAAWNQLLVPIGFAHGYMTLEPGSEVQYKVSRLYRPDAERAICFDDPALAIAWPESEGGPLVSERDRNAPTFAHAELPERWG